MIFGQDVGPTRNADPNDNEDYSGGAARISFSTMRVPPPFERMQLKACIGRYCFFLLIFIDIDYFVGITITDTETMFYGHGCRTMMTLPVLENNVIDDS